MESGNLQILYFESVCGINYDENNAFCVFMISFCFEKKA